MKVLVIGGYGSFGRRIVKRLRRLGSVEVLTAGRNPSKADVVLDVLQKETLTRTFREIRPHLVIHTAGPFDETEGYSVAKACLASSTSGHKCNYIDLADNTDYVLNIGKLDEEARKIGCLLVSGASTTPGITTSIISQYCPSFFVPPSRLSRQEKANPFAFRGYFQALSTIDIDLTVANSSVPGQATVRSVLSYCGKPIRHLKEGKLNYSYGWKTRKRKRFPGMTNSRFCSDVSVPDVEIFTAHIDSPSRSPHFDPKRISPAQYLLKNFNFRAGVESSIAMMGLSLLSFLSQYRLFPLPLSSISQPLMNLNSFLNNFSGKQEGGMMIKMDGSCVINEKEVDGSLLWALHANGNDGPEIPCSPAIVIASKLYHIHKYRNAQVDYNSLVDRSYMPGAKACIDMIPPRDLTDSIRRDDLDIQEYLYFRKNGDDERTSTVFDSLDVTSKDSLSCTLSSFFSSGGVVSGDMKMSVSWYPWARLTCLLFGFPVPWRSNHTSYRVVATMGEEGWRRYYLPNNRDSLSISGASYSRDSDFFLDESLLWGFLRYSILHKSLAHKRVPPSPRDRPWVYDGFKGECVKASVFFGYLKVPLWLVSIPSYAVRPHQDGLGWDFTTTISVPVLGEVAQCEGPMRVSHLNDNTGIGQEEQQHINNQAKRILDLPNASVHQKVLGKYVLLYDSECVVCDSAVDKLMDWDSCGHIMFCSVHDRKSSDILSALGFVEKDVEAMKNETIFVVTPVGNVLTYSDALLALLQALPGAKPWLLYQLLKIQPRFLRDRVYGYIARNRHAMLGSSKTNSDICVPLRYREESIKQRFL